MASLITNASAQTALRQLRAVEARGDDTRLAISTGLKIRGAADNPAYFLVSNQVKSDVAVLTGVRENLKLLEGAIKASDAGLRQIDKLVLQLADMVAVAQNDIAVPELEAAFDDILDQIRSAIDASGFQGTNLLKQENTTSSIIGLNRTGSDFQFQTLNVEGGDFLRDTFFDGLLEESGAFVINAEDYTTKASALGRADGLLNEWVPSLTNPGFLVWEDDGVNGGGAPDSPSNRTDLYRRPQDATNFAPRLDYRVQVNTPGRYYVNVRGIGSDGASDSIHVGFNGTVLSGTGGVRIPSAGGNPRWGTRDTLSNARVFVDIATPGTYTINIWGREDGTMIDGIQFTSNTSVAPTGSTPLPPLTPISGSDLPYYTDGELGAIRRDRAGVMELLTLINPGAMRLAPQSSLVIIDAVRDKVNQYQSQIGAYEKQVLRQQTYLDDLTSGLNVAVADLIEADLEEESSRLQAVQVAEQLAMQSLASANAQPSLLLSLFR